MATKRAFIAGLLLCAAACSPDASPGPNDSSNHEKSTDGASEEAPKDYATLLDLENRDFPLLVWAAHLIQEDYFDKQRFAPKQQLAHALDELGLHTPEFFGERNGDVLTVTVNSTTEEFDISGVTDERGAADVLERVLGFAAKHLGLEGEPLHELEYAAINGFVAPLDPHTVLLTPEENADLGVKTRGHFGGIGAEIRPADRRILVVRVLPGSPSQKAGLEPGDVILEIERQSTVNMPIDDAQNLLRGPIETKVSLKVRRGDETLTVEITRGTIHVESVIATLLPEGVGYLQITNFQEDTAEKLGKELEQMQATLAAGGNKLAGVIVDVRNNSGGLLTQATEIMDQMTTEGELVVVRSATGIEREEATEKLLLPSSVPVIALVNEESASASEIVSGAVKHLGRGIVVGRPSFGKGTVQMLRRAEPYGRELALKMTVAEYRVAGDRQIQTVGVRPDVRMYPVELSEFKGVGKMYDFERFERAREHSRIAHLPSAKHEDGAGAFVRDSPLSLHYHRPSTSVLPAEGPTQLADPEIRLAHEIAVGLSGVVGRPAQLEALEPLVAKLAATEDARVVDAIAGWEVDWSDEVVSSPQVELRASIATAIPVTAGEEFVLRVEVENTGNEAIGRVHAITDCNRDELDGIELLLGRLEPGEPVVSDLRLHVMPWQPDFEEQLKVELHAGPPREGDPVASATVPLQVAAVSRPRLAFDYWVVDDARLVGGAPKRPKVELFPGEEPFVVEGNGDGLLQPGERVMLAFRARNAGPGPSVSPRAVLRNLSGTQGLLEEGLVELPPLPAGAEASGAFGITISKNADPALPLELELIVGDSHVRDSVRDKLRFRIEASGAEVESLGKKKERRVVGPDGARAYGGASGTSARVTELGAGIGVSVVARSGKWLAVELGKGLGRRVWVLDEQTAAAGKGEPFELAGWMVDPPVIEIGDSATTVSTESVEVKGSASHAEQVRDIVIKVKADGPGGAEHKVYYLANPEREGQSAKRLEFAAEVPLERGGNKITLLARDGNKVERRRDLWVWRD